MTELDWLGRQLLQLRHRANNGCSWFAPLGADRERCPCGRSRSRPQEDIQADRRTMRWLRKE